MKQSLYEFNAITSFYTHVEKTSRRQICSVQTRVLIRKLLSVLTAFAKARELQSANTLPSLQIQLEDLIALPQLVSSEIWQICCKNVEEPRMLPADLIACSLWELLEPDCPIAAPFWSHRVWRATAFITSSPPVLLQNLPL